MKDFNEAGWSTLGAITTDLIDSDRLDGYDDTRVYDAVLATPSHFWQRYIAPALDRMADDLIRGFEESDLTN